MKKVGEEDFGASRGGKGSRKSRVALDCQVALKRRVVLKLHNLVVGYGGQILVDKVNLDILRGDFVAIVGANGSGKSTLVKTILGLMAPVRGEVKFLEKDDRRVAAGRSENVMVEGGRSVAMGRGRIAVGYLPQEMRAEANFPATVQEIVRSGALGRMGARPRYAKADLVAAEQALEVLGIMDLRRKRFGDLSGGQKQKVLLARALVASGLGAGDGFCIGEVVDEDSEVENGILILDEPSNSLDYASREDFYKILRKLNEKGLTILMITHDLDFHDLIGNKILAIEDKSAQVYETSEYIRKFHPTHGVVDGHDFGGRETKSSQRNAIDARKRV